MYNVWDDYNMQNRIVYPVHLTVKKCMHYCKLNLYSMHYYERNLYNSL